MKIAVIQGGPSTEAEVSRKSARAIEAALQGGGHEAMRFELNAELPQALLDCRPDVVFPVVHGAQGEDGCLQGLLEVLGFPYVGSDVRSCAIAADKVASKVFFRDAGLLIAKDRVLTQKDLTENTADLLLGLRADLGTEMIVKPSQGGSTIGIERLLKDAGPDDLSRALETAFRHDDVALLESYIIGRELTCGVLDCEEGPRALPVTLINAEATAWYDFESKYSAGGSSHLCPAPLDAEVTKAVQNAALAAHIVLGARDLSRSDFILTADNRAFLLELNSLPGMTDTSLFPEAALAWGLTLPQLADHLVQRAALRGAGRRFEGQPLPGV